MLANTYEELESEMRNCFQFQNMNMLEHGLAVKQSYDQLISQFNGGGQIIDLPSQIAELYDHTKHLIDSDLSQYQIYHDCGKHICRTIDENGKQHFPDHAKFSYMQYLQIWPDDIQTAELILMDMDFHIKKGDELIELWKAPQAPSLYFTAWAEIIANSKMFGGFDSTSFKIKKKQLINAAKKFKME